MSAATQVVVGLAPAVLALSLAVGMWLALWLALDAWATRLDDEIDDEVRLRALTRWVRAAIDGVDLGPLP